MKNRLLTILVLALVPFFGFGQSPSEADMAKMMDSMFADAPKSMQNMIKGMMQQEQARIEAKKNKENEEKQKREAANKKAQAEMMSEIKTKGNADSYYWQNTIASDTDGKFKNWTFGKADIKASLYDRKTKESVLLKIGEISPKGQVTFTLPDIDFRKWPRTPITESFSEGNDLFTNEYETLEYSNKNATYFADSGLDIYKGEENIGFISMANSVVTNGNLGSPYGHDRAGDGYIAYWVFMSQANTIKGKVEAHAQSIDTDLNFKKGWNLVVTRVEGKTKNPENPTSYHIWKNKYHTATTTLPADAKFYFNSHLVKDVY